MAKINQEKNERTNLKELLFKYKFVWIFAVLVALVAGLSSWIKGDKFIASLAITVSRQGTQESVDYKYDNYYAIKASDEFGNTVVGWFKTPEIADSINKKIGVSSNGWSLSDLSGRFRTTKISPNVVEVRYGATSDSQAGQVAGAIDQVISEKVSELNSISGQGIDFLALVGQPVVVKNSYNYLLNALAGFLIGLVFAFFVAAAKDYLWKY